MLPSARASYIKVATFLHVAADLMGGGVDDVDDLCVTRQNWQKQKRPEGRAYPRAGQIS